MRKIQIFTILSIIASLFVITNNQQLCLPDGCFFVPQEQVCQDGKCMNEDVRDHFAERANFLMATVKNNNILLQFVILLFVSVFLFNYRPLLLRLSIRFKSIIRDYSFVYNGFIELFSKGVLHPKIYQLFNHQLPIYFWQFFNGLKLINFL